MCFSTDCSAFCVSLFALTALWLMSWADILHTLWIAVSTEVCNSWQMLLSPVYNSALSASWQFDIIFSELWMWTSASTFGDIINHVSSRYQYLCLYDVFQLSTVVLSFAFRSILIACEVNFLVSLRTMLSLVWAEPATRRCWLSSHTFIGEYKESLMATVFIFNNWYDT